MKLVQLLLAFGGGSWAISEGADGHVVGLIAFLSALFGTMLILRLQRLISRPHGADDGALGSGQFRRGEELVGEVFPPRARQDRTASRIRRTGTK